MLRAALACVLLPVSARNQDAGEEQRQKQERQEPADAAVLVIAGAADEKQPSVIERVGAHGASPAAWVLVSCLACRRRFELGTRPRPPSRRWPRETPSAVPPVPRSSPTRSRHRAGHRRRPARAQRELQPAGLRRSGGRTARDRAGGLP